MPVKILTRTGLDASLPSSFSIFSPIFLSINEQNLTHFCLLKNIYTMTCCQLNLRTTMDEEKPGI